MTLTPDQIDAMSDIEVCHSLNAIGTEWWPNVAYTPKFREQDSYWSADGLRCGHATVIDRVTLAAQAEILCKACHYHIHQLASDRFEVIHPWFPITVKADSPLKVAVKTLLALEADGECIKVLPVLLTPCKIPTLLADVKYADFSSDFETGIADLLEAIRHGMPNE